MLVQAVLLGIIAAFGMWDGRVFGQNMLDRPLILATLVGIVLGDVGSAVIIGATLELVFMGAIGIGVGVPPDHISGTVLGTAFALMSGQGAEIALALALPISLLTTSLGVLCKTLNGYWIARAEKYADVADFKGIGRMMGLAQLGFSLSFFLPTFLAMLIGAEAVTSFVNAIPVFITGGLSVASGMLPALGFALLISMMMTKKFAPFFFVGFVLAAYLGLGTVPIAVLAVCMALILTVANYKTSREVA